MLFFLSNRFDFSQACDSGKGHQSGGDGKDQEFVARKKKCPPENGRDEVSTPGGSPQDPITFSTFKTSLENTDLLNDSMTVFPFLPDLEHPGKNSARGRLVLPRQRQPLPQYQVVLWDDDQHTYWYVIYMLHKLFGYSYLKSYQLARDLNTHGMVVCLVTSLEHAEFKRNQIQTFGEREVVWSGWSAMKVTILPNYDLQENELHNQASI
ncbi:MAG: ATP-dependent Clp protease adaptor ClpS [Pirellulaceae bacterium]|nr:ATP-dependent Clp protease adaptor ClpS [Pirellulaceae bacterium]